MSGFQMVPPSGRTDLEYGGRRPQKDGLPVAFCDVNALLATGWTFTDGAAKASFDKAYEAYKKALVDNAKKATENAKKAAEAQAKKSKSKKKGS